MKFLKQKTLSKFTPNDNTLITNQYGRSVMDLTGAVRLPKGTTAQRPNLVGVRTPNGADGYIRYNTSVGPDGINEIGLEAYVGGAWEVVKAPRASTIIKDTFGPGDAVAQIFGPLEPYFALSYAASPHNLIVLVENVWQIAPANFSVTQNPYLSADGSGSEILATSMSSGTEYIIVTPGSTDFTSLGSADSNAGTTFTYNGSAVTGDGEVRETGYYLKFTEEVPFDKNITVYYGFGN